MDDAFLLLLILLAPIANVNGEIPLGNPPIACCKCNGLEGGKSDDDVKPTAPVANDRHAIALTTVILFLLLYLLQGRGGMVSCIYTDGGIRAM